MALIDDLMAWATEGLDADLAASVRKGLDRDNVKSKVASLKQQSEYQALVDAQRELEGDSSQNKLGARAYQQWYNTNAPAIEKLQKDIESYKTKYGALDAPNTPPATPVSGKQYSDDDIQRIVDARIQGQYSPTWTSVVKGSMNVLQKHMFAGRKNPVDIDKLAETAASKYNGNLELAYDDWIKPEVEKEQKAATEAEISRRVTEELQKRGANQHFPSSVDSTPGSMSLRTKDELDKFDKTALRRSLTDEWMSTAN